MIPPMARLTVDVVCAVLGCVPLLVPGIYGGIAHVYGTAAEQIAVGGFSNTAAVFLPVWFRQNQKLVLSVLLH